MNPVDHQLQLVKSILGFEYNKGYDARLRVFQELRGDLHNHHKLATASKFEWLGGDTLKMIQYLNQGGEQDVARRVIEYLTTQYQ